ncbi:MAG: hypothetical protein JSS98_09015 [Bacteroidetes bacterium]|nr:hypothetical protein [Bacteroidota bacterium]
MEVKAIVQEIQRLPLTKKFWVMEQTLKSIKNEELSHIVDADFDNEKELSFSTLSVSEKSLAKDWLSTEDNRWDKIL